MARLIKWRDGEEELAEAPFAWDYGETHAFALEVTGAYLRAWLDDRLTFDLDDPGPPLLGGGVALLCAAGSLTAGPVRVTAGRRSESQDWSKVRRSRVESLCGQRFGLSANTG
jgi:hypothetical protein